MILHNYDIVFYGKFFSFSTYNVPYNRKIDNIQ